MSIVLIGSALVMGVVGQVHCATMCSGMAAVTCGGPTHGTQRIGLVHAGRIGAYVTQGAIFALVGAWVAQAAPVHHAQLVVRVVAGLVLVAAGLQLAGVATPLSLLERHTAGPLRRASSWLGRTSRAGAAGDFARGFAWGLLPCGLVQGALALALAAGRPQTGALVMLAFGLGTVPVLLVVARLARSVLALSSHPTVRRVAGGLILLAGAVQITMAAMDGGLIPVHEDVKPCCAGKGHG